jgi:hypothetical protein
LLHYLCILVCKSVYYFRNQVCLALHTNFNHFSIIIIAEPFLAFVFLLILLFKFLQTLLQLLFLNLSFILNLVILFLVYLPQFFCKAIFLWDFGHLQFSILLSSLYAILSISCLASGEAVFFSNDFLVIVLLVEIFSVNLCWNGKQWINI